MQNLGIWGVSALRDNADQRELGWREDDGCIARLTAVYRNQSPNRFKIGIARGHGKSKDSFVLDRVDNPLLDLRIKVNLLQDQVATGEPFRRFVH
jgi:hypothetical protein